MHFGSFRSRHINSGKELNTHSLGSLLYIKKTNKQAKTPKEAYKQNHIARTVSIKVTGHWKFGKRYSYPLTLQPVILEVGQVKKTQSNPCPYSTMYCQILTQMDLFQLND